MNMMALFPFISRASSGRLTTKQLMVHEIILSLIWFNYYSDIFV